jgi:hypothetical protein
MMPIPVAITQAAGIDVRGMLRGVYWPLGLFPTGSFTAQNYYVLDDVIIGGSLKKVMLLKAGVSQIAIDVGGNWD